MTLYLSMSEKGTRSTDSVVFETEFVGKNSYFQQYTHCQTEIGLNLLKIPVFVKDDILYFRAFVNRANGFIHSMGLHLCQ